MTDNKEQLLKRIDDLREHQSFTLTPRSWRTELAQRQLVLDILEHLLICDTARKKEVNMQLSDLKKQLENIPDDAEVTYGKYQGYYHADRKECLILTLGNNNIFIDIPRYEGLPGSQESS